MGSQNMCNICALNILAFLGGNDCTCTYLEELKFGNYSVGLLL